MNTGVPGAYKKRDKSAYLSDFDPTTASSYTSVDYPSVNPPRLATIPPVHYTNYSRNIILNSKEINT